MMFLRYDCMRKRLIICAALICAGLTACAKKTPEWEEHYTEAKKFAEQDACALALPEFDKAIEGNPDDPELYLQRGYCHLRNKTKDGKAITIEPQKNYDNAVRDFTKAEELAQGNPEMLDKIAQARVFTQEWMEAFNGIAPDLHEIKAAETPQENTPSTPLDPVTYSYTIEKTVVSTTCQAYNDQDQLIYQDFYNGGKDKAGDQICRTYFFYDEEGKRIREEYKWDSNAQWYELMGGKPNVKEYHYDSDGDLLTINFFTPPDYRLFRVDHYNKRGELIYTENIDQNGAVTVTESANYVPREKMEDWQALYDDALTLFNVNPKKSPSSYEV